MRYKKVSCLCTPCSCSSSGFPCVEVTLVYWSLRSTATLVICFHRSLLLAFALHFSSSSAFLRSIFTQSSHLSCGLPRFLEPSCLFVSALFGSLSSFIRTMCPVHFIRLLTILPTIQALVPTSSLRSFILRLSTLLTPSIFLIQLFSHTCSLCWCSSDTPVSFKCPFYITFHLSFCRPIIRCPITLIFLVSMTTSSVFSKIFGTCKYKL